MRPAPPLPGQVGVVDVYGHAGSVRPVMSEQTATAAAAGTIDIGGDITVNRLGFGAMRITGNGVWGPPPDEEAAKAVLRRAVELDVNFIDTPDSHGPAVSARLHAAALPP